MKAGSDMTMPDTHLATEVGLSGRLRRVDSKAATFREVKVITSARKRSGN